MGFQDWLFSPPVWDRVKPVMDRVDDWVEDNIAPDGPSKYVRRDRERRYQAEQRQGVRGRETLRRERRARSAERWDRAFRWMERRPDHDQHPEVASGQERPDRRPKVADKRAWRARTTPAQRRVQRQKARAARRQQRRDQQGRGRSR